MGCEPKNRRLDCLTHPRRRSTLWRFIHSEQDMFPIESESLKSQVRDFWNRQSCGTYATQAEKYSRGYFEDVEAFRYYDQAYIHEFAQFTRYHGKKVLEVGFGAGTDFIQWLRAGARVTGIDLTPEALENLTHRINVYQLPPPEDIRVADAENLPFAANTFDLGYSFGVLHHSPNTEKAIAELVRVVRPGGEIKIMVYNRHCLLEFKLWVKHALLRGQPWKSFGWAMWNHLESIGTKSYTRPELQRIFEALPLTNIRIHSYVTSADYLTFSGFKPLNLLVRAVLRLGGNRPPWQRENYRFADGQTPTGRSAPDAKTLFTGNYFGFFTCITAIKRA